MTLSPSDDRHPGERAGSNAFVSTLLVAVLAFACSSAPATETVEGDRLGPAGAAHDLLCTDFQTWAHKSAAIGLDEGSFTFACGNGSEISVWYPDVQRDRRRSILIPANTARWAVIRSSGSLRFSLAAFPREQITGNADARARTNRCSVQVSLGDAKPSVIGNRWVNVEIAVSGDLPFRLTSQGEGDSCILALAEPRIVTKGPVAERPANVLVYLVDTLRPDHLSVYGYARNTSPHLQEIADDAWVFGRAYSTAAWTRPATASLLTGLFPAFHGANARLSLPGEVESLAERFRRRGFSTWAVVTNGNVNAQGLGFEQGFDRFIALRGRENPNHATAAEVNQVLFRLLEERKDEPFFLYVHTVDPHAPYDPPGPFRGRFSSPGYSGRVDSTNANKKHLRKMDVTPSEVQHVIDLYDEEIAYQDAMLGSLKSYLEGLDLWRRLVFVFTSDHGEEFFEHGDWEHGKRLYEEQVRVPLVVRVPDENAERIEFPVQLVDVTASLVRWFGLDGADLLQGVELADASGGDRQVVYLEEIRPDSQLDLSGIVRGREKLILEKNYRANKRRYLAFDLAVDPHERADLRLSEPRRAEELRDLLLGHAKELRAAHPVARAVVEPELDDETKAQLQALGYLGQ